MSRQNILDDILVCGVVAVIRMRSTEHVLHVVDAIREGGVTAVEIALTTPGALEAIEAVAREMGDSVTLGVGSALDAEAVRRAVAAGARYVVSPVFKPEVVEAAHDLHVPVMPGAFTPTEIQAAHEAGADLIKVFPADVLGMPFIKAVLAPMPHLRLMPTGGVSIANAGAWIRTGARAVAVGSALLDRQAIAEGRFDALTRSARSLCRQVADARETA